MYDQSEQNDHASQVFNFFKPSWQLRQIILILTLNIVTEKTLPKTFGQNYENMHILH